MRSVFKISLNRVFIQLLIFKLKMFFRILFLLTFVGLSVGKYLKKFYQNFWNGVKKVKWRGVAQTKYSSIWAINVVICANLKIVQLVQLLSVQNFGNLMFADATLVTVGIRWLNIAIRRDHRNIQSCLFLLSQINVTNWWTFEEINWNFEKLE